MLRVHTGQSEESGGEETLIGRVRDSEEDEEEEQER